MILRTSNPILSFFQGLAVRNLWTVTLNGGYSTLNVYESNRQYVRTNLSVFPYLSGLGLDPSSGTDSEYWDIASLLIRAVDELNELCEKGQYSFAIPYIPSDNHWICIDAV